MAQVFQHHGTLNPPLHRAPSLALLMSVSRRASFLMRGSSLRGILNTKIIERLLQGLRCRMVLGQVVMELEQGRIVENLRDDFF
jgi:hypothetical protein